MSDHKIYPETELVKKFDYSSVFSQSDSKEVCDLVSKIILIDKNYFTNSPKYQTKENIFGRRERIWLKYRLTFLFSVFMYLGKEVKVSNMMAWSYMTSNLDPVDRNILWHHHWHPKNQNTKMMSGILYVCIPDDIHDLDTCGTEIAPYGPDERQSKHRYFISPKLFSWYIFPSDTWHRPGISQSDKNRFILAADIEYLP